MELIIIWVLAVVAIVAIQRWNVWKTTALDLVKVVEHQSETINGVYQILKAEEARREQLNGETNGYD